MRKKALCVGINDYPYDGADLNGCVNDARAWVNLLTVHYGFATQDVKLLVDSQARKSEIIKSLKSIASGTKKGDVLVFTISSQRLIADNMKGSRLAVILKFEGEN